MAVMEIICVSVIAGGMETETEIDVWVTAGGTEMDVSVKVTIAIWVSARNESCFAVWTIESFACVLKRRTTQCRSPGWS